MTEQNKSCEECKHNGPGVCNSPVSTKCLGNLDYTKNGRNGFEYNNFEPGPENCCYNCAWAGTTKPSMLNCEHHLGANKCLGFDSPLQYRFFTVDRPVEDDDVILHGGCYCPTIKGPRMYDNPGFVMCDVCKAFHKRYFPAFPGDPSWHLNHGAINRNTWGIRPAAIKTRGHEGVTDLQIESAEKAIKEAVDYLLLLEGKPDGTYTK